MTTKIFTCAISILFSILSFVAEAQEATTSINLVLADVFSIHSESAANGGAIDFNFNSVGDYNSEKIVTIPSSLIITFSKAFEIKVKANGANFESGTDNIPVDVITIRLNQSSSLTGSSNTIALSEAEQVLVSNAPLGSALTLDLDYIIPAAKSSSPDILGKPAGTYTQTVTYTATAL